jgi:glutathione synthase/RimK-type ligase-like ATP-grasp enzyme
VSGPVLLIATAGDPHVQAVLGELERRDVRGVVADLSAFPQAASASLHYTCCGDHRYELELDGEVHPLDEVRSVWWRRPQQPVVSPQIVRETHRLFTANEIAEALAGLWYSLDAFWVNDPARDHVAHRKVKQLRVAQQCGLRLPETLITNDPGRARAFIDRHGYRDVIYKSFSALEEEWRETRLIREGELELLDAVQHAPVIFQEYVPADYDVRITVVGQAVFAAAIHSQQTSYPVDFRMDMANAAIEPVTLPDEVEARLLDLMRRLGLQYGAIDMRRRPDGAYVFLEINPAGQWLFVEQVTQQPIAAALAELLAARDPAAPRELAARLSAAGSP